MASKEIFTPGLFGWIPPESRTDAEDAAHEAALRTMPKFGIKGKTYYGDRKKVALFDFSKQANGGKHRDPFFQYTGSCVGNGWGKVCWTLADVQRVKLGEAISLTMPFWLYTYGVGRWLINGRGGKGEGSLGSTQARAGKEYGTLSCDMDGLPRADASTVGISFGRKMEYDWSWSPSFDRKWAPLAKPHLIRTVAPVTTADDVRDAVCNGHAVTIASNWGGKMKCDVVKGVLLNKRVTRWPHQMCVLAWWEHEALGEIYWVQNSWGKDKHGVCPSGAPLGGFWVAKADMDYIARQKDSFAHSSYLGFPAQNMELDTYVSRDPGSWITLAV